MSETPLYDEIKAAHDTDDGFRMNPQWLEAIQTLQRENADLRAEVDQLRGQLTTIVDGDTDWERYIKARRKVMPKR